jgi:hypothetical protein
MFSVIDHDVETTYLGVMTYGAEVAVAVAIRADRAAHVAT